METMEIYKSSNRQPNKDCLLSANKDWIDGNSKS